MDSPSAANEKCRCDDSDYTYELEGIAEFRNNNQGRYIRHYCSLCYKTFEFEQIENKSNFKSGIQQRFYRFIWKTSEFFGINLGRFAPFIFGKMLGSKGKKVN